MIGSDQQSEIGSQNIDSFISCRDAQ